MQIPAKIIELCLDNILDNKYDKVTNGTKIKCLILLSKLIFNTQCTICNSTNLHLNMTWNNLVGVIYSSKMSEKKQKKTKQKTLIFFKIPRKNNMELYFKIVELQILSIHGKQIN